MKITKTSRSDEQCAYGPIFVVYNHGSGMTRLILNQRTTWPITKGYGENYDEPAELWTIYDNTNVYHDPHMYVPYDRVNYAIKELEDYYQTSRNR